MYGKCLISNLILILKIKAENIKYLLEKMKLYVKKNRLILRFLLVIVMAYSE